MPRLWRHDRRGPGRDVAMRSPTSGNHAPQVLLGSTDPQVTAILTNPALGLPLELPDGDYRSG